jgi:hypothetical protein
MSRLRAWETLLTNSEAAERSHVILWRRLDLPGHEAAALRPIHDGWRLSGVAVLVESNRPCRLEYAITCDAEWQTLRCVVSGFVGAVPVALDLVRAVSGAWRSNGALVRELEGCDDVDLGFSPSTNLLPIRRLRLAVGASAPVRAAWVRFPELTTEVLEQTYTRLAPDRYLYESAGGTFRRELTVDATGLVLDYPGLWIAEGRADGVEPVG